MLDEEPKDWSPEAHSFSSLGYGKHGNWELSIVWRGVQIYKRNWKSRNLAAHWLDLVLLHVLNATNSCLLKFLYRKIEEGDYQDENGGAKGRNRNRRSHDVGSEEQNRCKLAMAMDAIASSSFFVPFRQPSRLTFVLTSSSFVLHDSRYFLVHFVGRICSRPGHLMSILGTLWVMDEVTRQITDCSSNSKRVIETCCILIHAVFHPSKMSSIILTLCPWAHQF